MIQFPIFSEQASCITHLHVCKVGATAADTSRMYTGYHIPNGGLYKLVSCPNYLGETIEWTGYAITTHSLAGFAFAFYTFANLAPRAQHHHKWYKERFADYPANRKAYIPYLW